MCHCGDAATFLGPVGAADLARWPQAAEAIRASLSASWSTSLTDGFMTRLDRNGQPTGYLFQCRACHEFIGTRRLHLRVSLIRGQWVPADRA